MQPERAQPEPSPSEQNSLSRSNTNTRTSDRLKATTSEQPEPSDARSTARRTLTRNSPQQGSSREMTPPEGIQTIKYTRTGRVSRANKGKRVHDCEECGKTYTRAEHLRRHQQNHKPGAFPCDVPGCGRSFFREDLLVRHKARHNDPLNPVTAVASPASQHSDIAPVISEPLFSQPSGGQSVSTSADPKLVRASPQPAASERRRSYILGTSEQKRPAGRHTAHSRNPFAISVHGQTEQDNIGYISDSSLRHSSTGAASPVDQYFSGPPYYQPLLERTRHSSNASYHDFLLPAHTSASPVSAESSTICPPYWTNTSHDTVFQYLASIPSADYQYQTGVGVYDPNMIDVQLLPECRDLAEQSELAVHMISPESSSWNLNFNEPASSNEYRYLDAFWNHIHPFFPIVHRPSFNPHDTSPLLKASMIALGAQSIGTTADKTNARVLHERCIKVLKKRTLKGSHSFRVCDLQAVVLFEVYSIFKSRRPPLEFSSYFENAYELLASDPEVLHGSMMEPDYYQGTNPGAGAFQDDFPGSMFFPAENECKRRLLSACYILDQQRALLFGRVRSNAFPGDGANLSFPKSQASWDGNVHDQHLHELIQWPIHNVEGQNHLDEHAHDLFQSMHIVGSFFDSRREVAKSFAFGPRHDTTVLPIEEQSPRTQLTYHTFALCENVPMRDLLAVAGESWIMSEKLTREEEYIAAQAKIRSWVTSRRDSVAGFSEEPLQDANEAFVHALKILEIHRMQPKTGILFQEWAAYLAAVVIWARAYASATENQRVPHTIERRLSSPGRERFVSSTLAAGPEHDTTLEEAMNILHWTKSKIESVDSPHNCGLTNGALDVLRKLIAKGTAPGWF